ncbi:MAG: hypothetical protein ACRDTX_19735 [Pseudonocardiaceae bacterium]
MTTIQPPTEPPGEQRPAPLDYQATETPARGPRPRNVDTSFWLWVTYLTIGASNSVIGFIQRDRNRADAIEAVISQYPTMDRAMIENIATVVVVGVAVVGLLIVAVSLGSALLMRGGRNWARIVLTVIGSLSVLFLIGPVVTPLQALFQLALLVAAIVMMFLPPANVWFRPRPRRPEL